MKTLTIRHFYRGLECEYRNFYWLGLLSTLKVSDIKLWLTKRRLNKIKFAYNKEKLLEQLISMKDSDHKVKKNDLYKYLMGYYEGLGDYGYQKEIDWQLGALESEDVITIKEQLISVHPSALNKISDFQMAERRHNDSKNLTRAQIFLGVCMLIVTTYKVLSWLP